MVLIWITVAGVLMSAIALIGSITLVLKQSTLERILLPLVAFAAGSLLGGAMLHMIPASLETLDSSLAVFLCVLAGFVVFFSLEQFLHWHHCHRAAADCKQPLTYLILIGDGLHNFLGGIAVGGTFLIDIRLGVTTWIAAALHEIPQELGDFAVLVHGGWTKGKALAFNALSALLFLLGGLLVYFASSYVDVAYLVPFAAGNFLYIGASDLVPEINKHENLRASAVHLGALVLGISILLAAKVVVR
jgi:zinc and cadmium transporter